MCRLLVAFARGTFFDFLEQIPLILHRSLRFEEVGAFGWREGFEGVADRSPQSIEAASRGFAQDRFQLGECVLDRVKVRTIRWQVEKTCAHSLDRGAHAGPLVAVEIL